MKKLLSVFAIIGLGIGSYRVLIQARQGEMVRIASSHEARLLYEDWLKEYDAKYLTEEGVIKSYEVDLKHFRKNPMGGFYVRLYINHDENLKFDVSMISWTRFGRIISNQRRCPNVTKIYKRIQRNYCSIARIWQTSLRAC